MADDRDPKELSAQDAKAAKLQQKQQKKEEKARKKQEKKEKKAAREAAESEQEETKAGGRLVLFFVTLLIIAIWLGIIALLIKSDVGGFGSSVLYPLLKDVPYVNRILPEPEGSYSSQRETETSPYRTLDDALVRIRELELELDEALGRSGTDSKTIEDLRKQIDELMVYKEEEAAFEKEKEKFYEEVVLSDEAPDINEYRAYYESIDPENAAVLYKQVIEQITYNESVQDYVKTYSQMAPKDAAEIFNKMTGNLGLVADILESMGTKSRSDILAEMDVETAARLTEIMEPEKK